MYFSSSFAIYHNQSISLSAHQTFKTSNNFKFLKEIWKLVDTRLKFSFKFLKLIENVMQMLS